MEEHNKKTLIESLSSLREYEPPESLWESIEQQLEDDQLYSGKQLQDLPEYTPPDSTWQKISSRLEGGKVIGIGWRRTVAIAASLALLLAAWWQFRNTTVQSEEGVIITYSTVEADPMLLHNDWNEDEEAFEQFYELCKTKQYICEHPEFRILQSELDELTEAKLSIVDVMGDYGANPELVNQVTDIELERTDILKKMMAMLI